MSEQTSRNHRSRSPFTDNSEVIYVEFTDRGDAPLDLTRERKGRPERSPSLPPLDEPKPTEGEPKSAE